MKSFTPTIFISKGDEILTSDILKKKALEYANITEKIKYTDKGKPYIENAAISVTHDENVTAVIIAPVECIGIDMEKIKNTYPSRVADRFFSEDERKAISNVSDFYKIWCQKVSVKERPVTDMSQVEKALREEGQDILSRIDPRAFTVALCVEGKQLSSEEFADLFEKVTLDGYSNISFVIGSSHGLSDEVKKRANLKLSFSKMTFPHQLMRVILSEQVYRALSIINGSKYHK